MLKEKVIQEEIEIVDGKVFAVFSCKEERRLLDGCEMRKELAKEIEAKREELEALNKAVEKTTKELTELLQQDNALVGEQYCNLSTPVYKTIDGIVQVDEQGNAIIEGYTHDEYCPHKEERE